MSSGTGGKAVKLPQELITLLVSDGVIRNPGIVLYKAYKEYMVVKTLTDTMRQEYNLHDPDMCMAAVITKAFQFQGDEMNSIREDCKKLQQEIDEMKKMLEGFQIFVKRGGQSGPNQS